MSIIDKAQFKQGKDIEAWLDYYFTTQGWHITQTTPHEERVLHIGDRHFSRNGKRYTIEYKSGIQSYYTGNIFLETVSVDTQQIPGWVYTCQADYLFYAALLNEVILIFKPSHLRSKIHSLKKQFREVKTSHQQNDGYNTHGLLIPLDYGIQYLADKVIRL
jgi:hypothetical protein